jgi:hypothetical protein
MSVGLSPLNVSAAKPLNYSPSQHRNLFCQRLKLVRCPRSLAPTFVALPSMSLIRFAPFSFLRFPRFSFPLIP